MKTCIKVSQVASQLFEVVALAESFRNAKGFSRIPLFIRASDVWLCKCSDMTHEKYDSSKSCKSLDGQCSRSNE